MDVINEQTLAESHVIHKTRADFSKRMPQDVVHLVQYDNSLPVLKVDLYLNGSSYTLPSLATVYIRWGKKDHTFVYKEVLGKSQDGKSVYVEVDDQMTYYFGNPAPILELKLGETSAGSSPLNVTIDRNPIQNGDIESHSEYPDLVEAVERAEQASADAQDAAERAEEAASHIDDLTDQVNANTAAITAIKDGTNIDSFADVESALAGKQDTIDVSHMLDADLVDDANATHKFVTAAEKAQITANQNAITALQSDKADLTNTDQTITANQIRINDIKSLDNNGDAIIDMSGNNIALKYGTTSRVLVDDQFIEASLPTSSSYIEFSENGDDNAKIFAEIYGDDQEVDINIQHDYVEITTVNEGDSHTLKMQDKLTLDGNEIIDTSNANQIFATDQEIADMLEEVFG